MQVRYVNKVDFGEYSQFRIVLQSGLCYDFCITLRKEGGFSAQMDGFPFAIVVCSFGAVRFGFVCSFVLVRHMGFGLYTDAFLYVICYLVYIQFRIQPGIECCNVDTSGKLVDTCAVILQSDRTLEQVCAGQEANNRWKSCVECSLWIQWTIRNLRISVTSKDPQQAALLCNTLVACAPSEILRVLQAGNVKVVDSASVPEKPTSPDLAVNTIIGGLLGLGCSITAILVWKALMDISEPQRIWKSAEHLCLQKPSFWLAWGGDHMVRVENQSTLNKRRICWDTVQPDRVMGSLSDAICASARFARFGGTLLGCGFRSAVCVFACGGLYEFGDCGF